MSLFREISYGALLCPAGVHVVSCSRRGGELRIERYSSTVRPGLTSGDAVAALGQLLEADGARGKRVAVAMTGFGGCYQILTLPPAGRELLQPIVTRELRRFYPDVFAGSSEPIVDFVALGAPEQLETGAHRDLLVAAVPQDLLREVAGELSAREIQLEHWTIVPRALQRLYEAFAGPEPSAAALVLVPEWPLLGFFHDGYIRLFTEPRSGAGPSSVGGLVDHVERGGVFLRQQFRGAAAVRLLLSVDRDRAETEAAQALRQQLSIPTQQFGPLGTAPGALAALGVALDVATDDGFNLLPPDLRPQSSAESWVRRLAVATGVVLALAAGWWGLGAVTAEARTRNERDALAHRLAGRTAQLAPTRSVIAERQAHAQRAALLDLLARDQRRLPEILWPLQAAEGRVSLRELAITRRDDGWHVVLGVTATGATSADASDALMALADQLGAELPPGALDWDDIVLDRQAAADAPEGGSSRGPIAASVEMSFILPVSKDVNE